jgi:DNA-binding IclR family transcriptional regulator
MSRSTERLISIMNCFAPDGADLSLTEIAEATCLDKSTVHRLLADYERHRLVRRDPVSKRYTLGCQLIEWGSRATESIGLRTLSEGFLIALRNATKETICLMVRDGTHRVCVAEYTSPHQVRRVVQVGRALPLTRGAGGPLTLAFLPDGEADAIIEADESLTAERKRTLRAQFPTLRQRGYGLSIHVNHEHGWSIAVPVFDQSLSPVATILLAAPKLRLLDDSVERYSRLMLKAAREISLQLGAVSWPVGVPVAAG